MDPQVVRIPSAGGLAIEADLHFAHLPSGVVVFAHSSESASRDRSPHDRANSAIARTLAERDFAILLLDLQTAEEDAHDIGLIGRRVVDAIDWLRAEPRLVHRPLALFGGGTGAAAALVAAAERREATHAIVTHDGRPDLAGEALPLVEAPTLLIVRADDARLAEMNRDAMQRMRAHVELELVPPADPVELIAGWCQRYLWSMA